MKWRNVFAGLCLAAFLAAGNGQALAQFTATITVDENGNGNFTNSTGFNSALPFAIQPDPGPGGLPNALTYGLLGPPGMVAGDLVLLEPGGVGAVSDIIRFNPNETIAGTTGALVFYSDSTVGDPTTDLADTGFPNSLYTNSLTVTEVGPEGQNGFTYTPTAGQPGFIAGAAGPVTYVIQSDVPPVPEPNSLTLIGIGTTVGLAVRWARRKRAAARS
jgi:hypothetical protein